MNKHLFTFFLFVAFDVGRVYQYLTGGDMHSILVGVGITLVLLGLLVTDALRGRYRKGNPE